MRVSLLMGLTHYSIMGAVLILKNRCIMLSVALEELCHVREHIPDGLGIYNYFNREPAIQTGDMKSEKHGHLPGRAGLIKVTSELYYGTVKFSGLMMMIQLLCRNPCEKYLRIPKLVLLHFSLTPIVLKVVLHASHDSDCLDIYSYCQVTCSVLQMYGNLKLGFCTKSYLTLL